jgi:hypothetical protein
MDQLLQGLFSNIGINPPEPALPPALEMLRSIGDEQTFMKVSLDHVLVLSVMPSRRSTRLSCSLIHM